MTIADAAHRLAQLYLKAADAQNATWAAMQGLIAAPGDEILYRDRMLACDLAGNPGGVETVMDELCEVVEALEPYDDVASRDVGTLRTNQSPQATDVSSHLRPLGMTRTRMIPSSARTRVLGLRSFDA